MKRTNFGLARLGGAATVPNLQAVLGVGNSAGSLVISNVGTPVNPADAVTKAYVDALPTGGTPSGSAFPGSPVNNQRFFRTDRRLDYTFDSASGFWLTNDLLEVSLYTSVNSIAATTNPLAWAAVDGIYDMYLANIHCSFFTPTTLDGVNFWQVTLDKVGISGTVTNLLTVNNSASSPNNWFNRSTSVSVSNAWIDRTNYYVIQTSAIKNGSPGNLQVAVSFSFRHKG